MPTKPLGTQMPAKMETLGGLSSLDTERLTAADAGDSD
jgi:hypothetical protein